MQFSRNIVEMNWKKSMEKQIFFKKKNAENS